MDDAVFSFWRKEDAVLCLGMEVQGEDPWLTTPEEGRVSLRLGAGSWGAGERGRVCSGDAVGGALELERFEHLPDGFGRAGKGAFVRFVLFF